MRKRRNYFASHASLTGQGASKQEASADLERQIDWALENRNPHVEIRFEQVIVIAATASGWQSTLVLQDQIAQHGFARPCWSFSGQSDFVTLLRSARMNAAQCAWSQESDDARLMADSGLDESGQSELQAWINFQRNYTAAKRAGKTDAEAFDSANGRTPIAA